MKRNILVFILGLIAVTLLPCSCYASICSDCQTESPGDTCLDCGQSFDKMQSTTEMEQTLVGFCIPVEEIRKHISDMMVPEKEAEYFSRYGISFPVEFDHDAVVQFGNALVSGEFNEYELPAGMEGVWNIQIIGSSNQFECFEGTIDQIPMHIKEKPLNIGLIRDGIRYELYYSSGVLGTWCYVSICQTNAYIDQDDSIRVPHVSWGIYIPDPISATVDEVVFSILPDGNTEDSSYVDVNWYERIADVEEPSLIENGLSYPDYGKYPVGEVCRILASSANARSGAGVEYAIVEYVFCGERFTILDTSVATNGKIWYQIKKDGVLCWISSGICTVD